MRSVGVVVGLVASLFAGALQAQEPAQAKQGGLRGKVVVEPALLAATEGPLGKVVVEGLQSPSRVQRSSGRPPRPLLGPMPDLQVVLEGEDIRTEVAPPRTLVVEGYRFAPSEALLTRPGAIAIQNGHATPITVLKGTEVVATIAPGQTEQVTLAAGEQVLSLREYPHARALVKVLERGATVAISDSGEVPFIPLVDGEYNISFWIGADRIFGPYAFSLARNSLGFIEATVSANRVVTIAVKDASLQLAVPVAPVGPQPPEIEP